MSSRGHPMALMESGTLRSLGEEQPVGYKLCAKGLEGRVSDVQRRTIAYLCQSLRSRGVFLLGDGTGVGKGRVLAGTIAEYLARQGAGVRCLWCSANRTLHADACRDMRDVGAPDIPLLRTGMKATDYSDVAVAFVSYGTVAYDEDEECLAEVVAWMRQMPARLLLLDEAHLLRRKSASASRIQALINLCSRCDVVYSTATLASHPSHLRFVSHMIGGQDALCSVLKGDKGALEAVGIEMKMRGLSVSRQLDRSACAFTIVEHEFSSAEWALYDECNDALDEVGATGFARQFFLRALVAKFKVRTALIEARRALGLGRSVVVTVQHTGEAAARRDGEASCMLDVLRRLGCDVPARILEAVNAIDAIVLDLHGEFGVAEVTGRRTRLERGDGDGDGRSVRVRVAPIRKEIDDFQNGTKRVAVLSRAGSTGIGLHGSNGVGRTHIFLELPWSAEDHLQQCGRTHRADSSSPVHYVMISSRSVTDARVEGAVHDRLMSLGAVTQADRRACAHYTRPVGAVPCSTRRLLASRMMLAQAVRRFAGTGAHPAAREEPARALSRLGFRAGAPVATAVCASLSENPTAERVALCLAALKPLSLTWTLGDWTRDPSSLPSSLREQVAAIRECSCDRTSRLSILPEPIVDMIIDGALGDYLVDPVRTADMADALEECVGSFHMFITQPLAWTLNRATSLPLTMQATLLQLLRSHAVKQDRSAPIQEIADVLSTPTTRIKSVTTQEQTSRRSVVVLEFEVDAGTASVCRRAHDGRVFVAIDKGGGDAVTLQSGDAAGSRLTLRMSALEWANAKAAGVFAPCEEEEARPVLDGALRAAGRCARRLSGRYLVLHSDMIRYWHHSKKTIVRYRPVNRPGVHVGLLVGKAALF